MIIDLIAARPMAVLLPEYIGALVSGEIVGPGPEMIDLFHKCLPIAQYVSLIDEPFPKTLTNLSRMESFGYSETLRQVHDLSNLPESDAFGRLRPSPDAIQAAGKILVRMLQSGFDVPSPEEVSTDRDGDLRVAWEREGRSLELVCPFEGDRRPYIFYADDLDHDIAYDMGPYRLGRLLAWLAGLGGPFPR